MKRFLIALITLISCNEQQKTEPQLSQAQNEISDITLNYMLESNDAKNDLQKQDVDTKYQQMLHSYLKTHAMDSMAVHVDKISRPAVASLELELSDQNAKYHFSKEWDNVKAMEADSCYQLIKSLPEGQDVTLNMQYTGDLSANHYKTGFVIAVIPKK